jgi:hypothetical protein
MTSLALAIPAVWFGLNAAFVARRLYVTSDRKQHARAQHGTRCRQGRHRIRLAG